MAKVLLFMAVIYLINHEQWFYVNTLPVVPNSSVSENLVKENFHENPYIYPEGFITINNTDTVFNRNKFFKYPYKNMILSSDGHSLKYESGEGLGVNDKSGNSKKYMNYTDCDRDFLSVIDRIDDTIKSFLICDGAIEIVRTRDEKSITRVGIEEDELSARFLRYLRNHAIRIRLPELIERIRRYARQSRTMNFIKSWDSNEGRGRLKKFILPTILVLMLKFTTLMPMFLSGVALLSVLGLLSGLTSLFVSTVLGLRALFTRDSFNPGFAPRLAVIRPNFIPVDALVQADFYHGLNRNGGDHGLGELAHRNYQGLNKDIGNHNGDDIIHRNNYQGLNRNVIHNNNNAGEEILHSNHHSHGKQN